MLVCVMCVCGWEGCRKRIIFLSMPSETWLSLTGENKFLGLPILEAPMD